MAWNSVSTPPPPVGWAKSSHWKRLSRSRSTRNAGHCLEVAREAKFLAKDGSWRSVRELNSEVVGGDDELLICAFAPEHARLDERYRGVAIEFFKVARAQSGYGPHTRPLAQVGAERRSAKQAHSGSEIRCVRPAGPALADAMRSELPGWLPVPLERLLEDPLLIGWPEEDRKRLIFELGGHHLFSFSSDHPGCSPIALIRRRCWERYMIGGRGACR